jgi:hypothetical protein
MPPVQLTKKKDARTCTIDEVSHTKQYEKDTQEDDNDFITGDESERLGTWHSIMSEHTKRIVEQLLQGTNKPTRIKTHTAKSTTRNNEVPNKMQVRM